MQGVQPFRIPTLIWDCTLPAASTQRCSLAVAVGCAEVSNRCEEARPSPHTTLHSPLTIPSTEVRPVTATAQAVPLDIKGWGLYRDGGREVLGEAKLEWLASLCKVSELRGRRWKYRTLHCVARDETHGKPTPAEPACTPIF